MLNNNEKECLLKFINLHVKSLRYDCNAAGVSAELVIKKITHHKASEGALLTKKEHAVIAGFIRKSMKELNIWCGVFECHTTGIINGLRRMAR